MSRTTAIILIPITLIIYYLFVWEMNIFGPGGNLFFTVLTVLALIFLLMSIGKSDKNQHLDKKA
ncbi:MAG: hypothetical protein ACPG21_13185 [Crocinitomicaceae bacterium]